MNHLSIIGRLTRDVVLKNLGEERYVLNNAVAVNRSYKSDNGNEADFIPIVAWGKRAEILSKYCQKGDMVGLEGKINTRTYENEDGVTIYVTEMLVDQISLLDQRRSGQPSSQVVKEKTIGNKNTEKEKDLADLFKDSNQPATTTRN